jgi:hypothetical protein
MRDVVIIFAILLVLLLLISTFGGSIRYKSPPQPRFADPSAYPPAAYPPGPFGGMERFEDDKDLVRQEKVMDTISTPAGPEGFYEEESDEVPQMTVHEQFAEEDDDLTKAMSGGVEAFTEDKEYADVLSTAEHLTMNEKFGGAGNIGSAIKKMMKGDGR